MPVLAQALLGLMQELLDDALARLVVDDEVGDVVALGRGVLGVEADVEVEAGAVLAGRRWRCAPRGMTFSNR